jgi:hypothetical protein
VVNSTSRQFYSQEREPLPILQEAGWAPAPKKKRMKEKEEKKKRINENTRCSHRCRKVMTFYETWNEKQ